MNTFDIGTKVWMSIYGRNEYKILCSDCSGTRRIGITLPGGESYTIPCQGCISGYAEASGYIKEYVFETQVRQRTVTGVRISAHDPVEYELDGGIIGYLDTVFATEAEALEHGEVLKTKAEDEANKSLHPKFKDHRSWAWHVTYYRRELKRAQHNVERYEKMLGIAKEKIK